MKYALEVRVPLLDFKIINFAINLSPSLKHHQGIDKYLLKQVLYDYIPKEYFNRPKWGFALPIALWLQNELKPLINEYLSDEAVKQTNILNPLYVSKLKTQFFSGKNYLYGRIWNLLILQKWLLNKLGIKN
jgi:asparagine synthase (glutamine-hydrolysing)